MTIALSVNLNKIALIRNSREGNSPDITEFGEIALRHGADGITVHPRPDQRHIRPSDVFALSQLLKQYPDREFNIEGNPFAAPQGDYPGLMALVEQTLPQQCTLVPDTNSQLTSDHGFNLITDGDKLLPIIATLKSLNVRISLFMDPDIRQIELAKQIGADRIELYTGPYAENYARQDLNITPYVEAAEYAHSIGIGINAGHDLNLTNLPLFATVPGLQEVSIGHALTIDALRMGMATAVQEYLRICRI